MNLNQIRSQLLHPLSLFGGIGFLSLTEELLEFSESLVIVIEVWIVESKSMQIKFKFHFKNQITPFFFHIKIFI